MTTMLVIAVSFAVAFALIPGIISYSNRKRLLDDPKGDSLKIHKAPTPTLGGVGIFGGFVASLLLASIMSGNGGYAWVLICSVVIVGLGIWDDLKNIKPYIRFAVQMFVAGLTVYTGLKVDTFPMLYVAIPLTAVYILGSINSINLFDGLDGLAGGVVSISLTGFSILFYTKGDATYMVLSLALLGGILGFLPYNFNPASIFMGDNGSTLLGYILSVLAIKASSVPYDLESFMIPIVLIGLPIIDTATAITRRLLKGRPVFAGDRSHIYDQLVDAGLSVKQTALICYSMQLFLVAGAMFWVLRY